MKPQDKGHSLLVRITEWNHQTRQLWQAAVAERANSVRTSSEILPKIRPLAAKIRSRSIPRDVCTGHIKLISFFRSLQKKSNKLHSATTSLHPNNGSVSVCFVRWVLKILVAAKEVLPKATINGSCCRHRNIHPPNEAISSMLQYSTMKVLRISISHDHWKRKHTIIGE